MVPVGEPVDNAIAHLISHLEAGDVLIDGGNSFFLDTERRENALIRKDYLSLSVSGGEHGALVIPCLATPL
jgi:6-phosphogluconate dehydrogenase